MVSPLEYKSRDPESKGRGNGFYYKRGSGYSKYSKERDISKGRKTGGARRYAHATDKVSEAGKSVPKDKKKYLAVKNTTGRNKFSNLKPKKSKSKYSKK